MYPDFQYISFHEQSDRVSFLEGKVFQYGWIFLPFSFFTEKLEGLYNIHLNENSKRPWDHPRWHTYQNLQTSLPHVCRCFTPTLLYETNKVADQPGYRTFLSAPLLWIQTLNILSDLVWVKLSANNISRRHEDQIRRFHATCCFKSWVARGALAHKSGLRT